MTFPFSNLSGRPQGSLVRLAARVLPGVRSVQGQVGPFADEWQRRNAGVLDAVTADPDGAPLWVAIGDSMTVGIGASSPSRGWVGQLADRMLGWRVLNLGINGGRTQEVVDRALPLLASLPRAPDLVTLLIGSNDLMSRARRGELTDLVPSLLSRLPAGTVVGNQPGSYPAALQLNRMIDEAVAAGHVVLADLRDPRTRSWRGKLAADNFHPGDGGYTGIADIFAEAIRPLTGDVLG